MADDFKEAALEYHRARPAGKIQVVPTKPLATQHDLSLAYTPGVADACRLIEENPLEAANMTSRANLVAVVTNGTAVLGLGDIGPLASKPVMEGKGVLFKKFAGVDVFDIEIDEKDPDKLVDIIASLEPTFGGINLEDIKSPECFEVEQKLSERMGIPVFHDDQHGTAIIASAATINGLKIIGKEIEDVTLVVSGAGAAAIACVDLLIDLGLKSENIVICDSKGAIRADRENLPSHKIKYATKRDVHQLSDAIKGADMFLGVSVPGVLTGEMVETMAAKPLILALANPTPEILPSEVLKVRDDAVIATGRSDFPNQVNNAVCFPYIFRGALDVGATCINSEMKMACVYAIAELARQEGSEEAIAAYGGQAMHFGPEYIIPKPFDPRLIAQVAPAVAKAAMDSGVAKHPIEDMDAYQHELHEFVFRTGMLMKPVLESAKTAKRRVVFAEGESESVLRSIQMLVDDHILHPIIIGRPEVVQMRIDRMGLRLKLGVDVELVNPQSDPRYKEYWTLYHDIMKRRGVTPDYAKSLVRTNSTVIAALMLKRKEVDAAVCGMVGRYKDHLKHVRNIIGLRDTVMHPAAMNIVILDKGPFFFVDTYVNDHPSAEQIAESTMMAAESITKFGVTPKAALVSHSNFGSSSSESAERLRAALDIIRERMPDLEIDGEMQMDAALSEERRNIVFPNSTLKGEANLLVFPSLDAANSSYNLIRVLGDGVTVGPILLGPQLPVHILTSTTSVRGIVNVSALAAMDAQTCWLESQQS